MKKLIIFTFLVLLLAFIYLLLFPFLSAETKEITGALRGYTPTFAAIITILLTSKLKGLKKYWKSIFRFKAPTRAYLIVFLIPIFINTIIVIITMVFTEEITFFAKLNPLKFIAIYIIFIFLDGPLGEELGWRGFFLPELLSKYSPLISSLLIGLVMFFWHMIIFSADGPELNLSFIVKYLISILGISSIFTYVYLKYSSLPIIAVLLHTSVNYFIFFRNSLAPEMKNTSIDNIAYVVLVVCIAIVCLYQIKIENLGLKYRNVTES